MRTLASVPNTPETAGSLRLMLSGDSQTLGNGGAGDDASGYREELWAALRNKRGRITLVGNVGHVGPTGRNSLLGDWRCSATGGHTLSEIAAQALVSEALCGVPDATVILGGTNDNAESEASAESTVDAMQAALVAYVHARQAANPRGVVFVPDLYPWVSPAADYAAHNAVRVAYNAELPELCASLGPHVHFVEAGSLLSAAHMDSSGIHANADGNRIVGRQIAEAILRYMPSPEAGPELPRNVLRRTARAAFRISANTGKVAIFAATDGLCPESTGSWSAGIRFYPEDMSNAALQRIFGWYTTGDFALVDVVGTTGVVQGWSGVLPTPTTQSGAGLMHLNKWHAIVISADASTGLVQTFVMRAGVDGRAVTMLGASAYATPWNITQAALLLGADADINGQPGLYQDLWVHTGRAVTSDEVEAFYYDGVIPAGVTAYYPLDEGSGATLHPAAGFTGLPNGAVTGTAWSAASAVPTPWDYGGDD